MSDMALPAKALTRGRAQDQRGVNAPYNVTEVPPPSAAIFSPPWKRVNGPVWNSRMTS